MARKWKWGWKSRCTELIRLCFQHRWIASLGAVSTLLSTPLLHMDDVWLPDELRATTACTFRHRMAIESSKRGPIPGILHILTWKCAARHNGVYFLNIPTSKSGPHPKCFDTFYFQMCLAPQRRALFQDLNFQKWSETDGIWYILIPGHNFSLFIRPTTSAPTTLGSLFYDPPEP